MTRVRSGVLALLAILLFWPGFNQLFAQQSNPTAPSGAKKCVVDRTPASPADLANYASDDKRAEKLYRAMVDADPSSQEAQAGVIQALLGQNRLREALQAAQRIADQHPQSSVAQTALAETYVRRGELDLARPVLARAITLDPCNGRAYFAQARFARFSGLRATEVKLLAAAHSLRPLDQQIAESWIWALPPAQRYPALNAFADQASLNSSDKEDLRSSILRLQAITEANCTVVSPKGGTRLVVHPGPQHGPDPGIITIDMSFNNDQRRLQLGTEGYGITIPRPLAERLGLKPDVRFSSSQLYRAGRHSYYLAHVASMRFGNVEFKNCPVQVVDSPYGIKNMEGADGYISSGFFRDFLVDINSPAETFTLSALPKLVDNQRDGLKVWSTAAENDNEEVKSVLTGEWAHNDRTTPPEMREWTQFYQAGSILLVPVKIGPGHARLFSLELDAPHPRISSTAVEEATTLEAVMGSGASANMKVISKAMGANHYFIAFGGLILPIDSWSSIDFTEVSIARNIDISGDITQNALKQLDVTINYRDDLIHFVRPAQAK